MDGTTEEAKPIYLDYQASTPLDPRALEAMLPFYRERFGNPHSAHHAYGRNAAAAVERAGQSLRDLRVAEVTAQDVVIENGKVKAFRTKLSLSFKFEN